MVVTMSICICNISALEVYRASGRLLPNLLALPRTSKLDACRIMPAAAIQDDMDRMGTSTRPYHLLVGSDAARHQADDVVCHVQSATIPARSFLVVSKSIMLAAPPLLFWELAANPNIDVIELATIGFELCGTYVLDSSWDGLTNTGCSITDTTRIGRMLEAVTHRHGSARAREALSYVLDNSNSPMETVLALLLTLPRRHGGLGLTGLKMNRRVQTPAGTRHVDLLFPELNIGLEYKGKEYHSIEQSGRDDRRQNNIVGSGVSILNVWFEDLCQPHLFQQLIQDFSRAAGIRLRIRDASFEQRQRLLLARLMPSIKRYGNLGAQ